MNKRRITQTAALAGWIIVLSVTPAFVASHSFAGTIENLERERALLIDAMLDPSLVPADRAEQIDMGAQRLVDLEKMVMRDDSLTGRNTPTVRRAFGNYDLTFLIHASVEKNMLVFDSWLDQLNVTTESLMAASKGRR